MPLKSLKVSSDGRFLTDSDGAPFFYLGDTAWQLFTLGREDADEYLRTRSEQKFNVIQAVIVSEFGGLQAQNAQGEIPFLDEVILNAAGLSRRRRVSRQVAPRAVAVGHGVRVV